MKYKNKIKRLEARQQEYDRKHDSDPAYKRPGSYKR